MTNVEIMLLQIINEKNEISGYDIDKIINERNYRNWVDIGTTSVYGGLKKLINKKYAECKLSFEKTGKGPIPKLFTLTTNGKDSLKNEVFMILSETRERDRRYDLGLAGINILSHSEIITASKLRIQHLISILSSIKEKFDQQGGNKLPYNVQMLFQHPIHLIKSEIIFVQKLIDHYNQFI